MNTTQLTVAARAAVALGSSKAEAELTALALQSKSITAVTSPDGRTECHAAAMTAKAARVGIEKAGKAARDDATQFSKAVIAEEKRLVALIAPEEARLVSMRDEWDSLIAREKSAKAEDERLAIVQIMTRIANIRNIPLLAAASTSNTILDDIERLEALNIDDSFKAYYGEAAEAKAASLQKLREIYAAKVRAESEALRVKQEQEAQFARMKAEREELARLRAEQEQRDAEAKSRREAEEAELQRKRDEIDAAVKVIDDQRKERQRIEDERVAAEKRLADEKITSELHRLAKELQASVQADPEPINPCFNSEQIGLQSEVHAIAAEMTSAQLRVYIHYGYRLMARDDKDAE